ncbi:amino acid/polyamine transporter I [Russula dissimulans]|nr:amino acid/polyamine transporter I [Russula dissimulans]
MSPAGPSSLVATAFTASDVEEQSILISNSSSCSASIEVVVPVDPGCAPVEKVNPLGREVTLLSAVMLNFGELLGSGIFSVPGVVLGSVGSVGLSLSFWAISPMFAFEVVFLEQAYPRPKFFVPATFAIITVLLSFSATNSVVFAQYTLSFFNLPITGFSQTVLAVGVVTFSLAVVALSTKWSLRAVNALSIFKVLSLVFVAVTGVAVLAGFTHISDPFANFRNCWQGGTTNPNALATALVKTNYAYVGWSNAFNVLGEVNGVSPVRTVRNAGFISLGVVTMLFLTVNFAYIAAVPLDEIKGSGQLVGLLFFQRVFGMHWASKILPVLVALSCVGNIVARASRSLLVVYDIIQAVGQTRVLREVARQGLLPYPTFFASTRPFGTPIGPIMLKYAFTVLVICALPARDAFNFLVDLASYPHLVLFHP